MLEWFRSWATGIVIAVIIATIIEMILPNSTSKKYIKIIIGIFIVYTVISPVIGSFKGEDLNNYIKVENYIQSSSNALQSVGARPWRCRSRRLWQSHHPF